MKPIQRKMIQLPSGRLEYACSGEGAPAVILINGGSGPIEGWYNVFHELAGDTSVLAYNRFGVGKSGKPSGPQHGQAVLDTLRELLQAAGVRPPYLLSGHSLGGLYANLFARKYPGETAGLVLLEASHPQDLLINDTQNGFIRTLNRLLRTVDRLSPHKKWGEVNFVEDTVRQIGEAGPFPDIPLVVVAGSKKPPMMPEQAYRLRTAHQQDFLQLSSQSRLITASRSGHFPQLSEPEIVIQAVKECLAMVRHHQN
ncbi:alpha/beta hydrolase [Paenibacillus sp. PK3_47]|uniref:alpha/beta fold hydrolase n=1 Tax=Paenibacillus sp. PK3_47 TaxID=2072642 RepID=UPI00201E0EAB|nr:alpha/beta hydrolase [Paenibacillus sp. PK3_47]UQZ34087.1 alpha/beta hydrolase [Paenibacillus sp. PK3_47]